LRGRVSSGQLVGVRRRNHLSRNNFTDMEKLQFCINEVLTFFDFRIPLSRIYIHRLDLCQYLNFHTKQDLQSYFIEELCPVLFQSNNISIRDDEKKFYNSHLDIMNKHFSILHRTLYINHHRNKCNGLTTVIYRPITKDNRNKVNIDSLLKIEIRGRGRVSGTEYSPCRLDDSVEDFLKK